MNPTEAQELGSSIPNADDSSDSRPLDAEDARDRLELLEAAAAELPAGPSLRRAELHGERAAVHRALVDLDPGGAAFHRASLLYELWEQAYCLDWLDAPELALVPAAEAAGVYPPASPDSFAYALYHAVLLRESGSEAAALERTDELLGLLGAQPTDWPADRRHEWHRYRAEASGLRGSIMLQHGLPDLAIPWIVAQGEHAQLELAHQPASQPYETLSILMGHWIRWANLQLALQRYAGASTFAEECLGQLGSWMDATGEETPARSIQQMQKVQRQLELVRLFASGRLSEQQGPAARETIEALLDLGEAHEPTSRQGLITALRGVEFAFRAEDLSSARRFVQRAGAHLSARQERSPTGGTQRESVAELALVRGVELGLARRQGAPREELRQRLDLALVAFDAFIDDCRNIPLRPGGIGHLRLGNRRFMVTELLQSVHELNGKRAALELLVRAQAGLSSGLQHPGDLAAFCEQLLPPGSGALFYLPAPGTGLVFAVDATGVDIAELPDDVHLRSLSQALSQELNLPPQHAEPGRAQRLEDAGQRLRAALFPKALAQRIATWSALTVLGGDFLGDVPFGALTLPDGRALGLDLPLAYLPSASMGLALVARQRSDTFGLDYLLAAGGTPGPEALRLAPDLQDLAGLEQGSRRLHSLFGSKFGERLYGEAATWTAVRDQLDRRPRVAQFLLHAVLDPSKELPASLVLTSGADDGLVRHAEFLALDEAPDMVLLTACRSAAAPLRPGNDGAGQLSGALLHAGSTTVLEALGDLELNSTVRLSELFLRELQAPETTPALALMRARRAMIAAGEFADPYYHARLRLVGLAHGPGPGLRPRPTARTGRLRLAALLVLVVAAAAGVRKLAHSRRSAAD